MPTEIELSNDSGNVAVSYVFYSGNGSRMACRYNTTGSETWYLSGIKYYTKPNWPNTTYEGFGVAAWQYLSSIPGAVIWPSNGQYVYNPNTGGLWIRQNVAPALNLGTNTQFVVGIYQLYDYPNCDSFGYDNTTPDNDDWANAAGAGWAKAPYGKGSARAIITNSRVGVESTTLGVIRTLYR